MKSPLRTLLGKSRAIVLNGNRRFLIAVADLHANLFARIAKRIAQQIAQQNGQRVLVAEYHHRLAPNPDGNAAQIGEGRELGSRQRRHTSTRSKPCATYATWVTNRLEA